MPNQPQPPQDEWAEADAVALKLFLERNPKFLHRLRKRMAKISKEQNIEARAMSGSEVKGAEDLLAEIGRMAEGGDIPQEKSPYIGAGE